MFGTVGHILSLFDQHLKQDSVAFSTVQKLSTATFRTKVFKRDVTTVDSKRAPIAMLANVISRGAPTYASWVIESHFGKTFDSLIKKNGSDDSEMKFSFENDRVPAHFFDQLSLGVLPTPTLRTHQRKMAGSEFEHSFISSLEQVSGTWVSKVLEQQVRVRDLVETVDQSLVASSLDYVITFPVKIVELKGLVIEMDGPQHESTPEHQLDRLRENRLLENGYRTIRIRTKDSDSVKQSQVKLVSQYLAHPSFGAYRREPHEKPHSDWLVLVPILTARIQMAILWALLEHPEWLDSKTIRIGCIERDVKAGVMAVTDLNHWFSHIRTMTGIATLPLVECELIDEPTALSSYDAFHLVLDVSIKSRENDLLGFSTPNSVVIRNAPLHARDNRRYVTGPHLPFKPLGEVVQGDWKIRDEAAVDSLRYFLHSVFRKRDFRPGQLPILDRVLSGKSVIGLLPTGGGKSLTYQIAGLLNPGVCLVVDPIISLMHDQVNGLKRNWIDACEYINSTVKSREERDRRQNRIKNGNALFFFLSPERLLIQDFRAYLKGMGNALNGEVYFNYCVIDEAHCVSEWGHDFRTSYLSVAENAIRFCPISPHSFVKDIPLFALTATASYDVLTDIQRELSGTDGRTGVGEESVVQLGTNRRSELTFSIQNVRGKAPLSGSGFQLKEHVANLKRERILELIERHKPDFKNGAGLVFCPHRGHFFGVTDQFKPNARSQNGVLDVIAREMPDIEDVTGFFMGADQDDLANVRELSMHYQDSFLEGNTKLLVATKAFGMGIDKPDIRYTIHLNYPNSIESFLQEAGRAGRDRKPAHCYLLYAKTDDIEEDVEYEVNSYFHSRAYRGAAKEKAIIQEILYSIHYPDRTYELAKEINAKYERELSVSIYTSKTGKRYVSIELSFTERIGQIMVRNDFPMYPGEVTVDGFSASEKLEILEFAKSRLKSMGRGTADDAWNWLTTQPDPIDGILKVIEKTKGSAELVLPFENNITERTRSIQEFVLKYLQRSNPGIGIQEVKSVVQAAVAGKGAALNFIDFIQILEDKLKTYHFNFKTATDQRDVAKARPRGETLARMEEYYNQIRDKADTEKAIYRMRLMGLVDDYTVDYRTEVFTLHFKRKTDQDYGNRLRNYLSKFVSEDRVVKEMKEASKRPGKQLVERYLNYLVDYGYEQIAKKRQRSILDMRDACKYGLERNSEDLAEYLDLYLNSKYFRDEYRVDEKNESLNYNLDRGKIEDIKWVWHYIDLMERDGNSELNNLKHLRGATLRMLRVTTENPVLLVLSAYAAYLLDYKSVAMLEEADLNLTNALDQLEERLGWSESQLIEFFDRLAETLGRKRPELIQIHPFVFDDYRMKRVLADLKKLNQLLPKLNKTLIPNG